MLEAFYVAAVWRVNLRTRLQTAAYGIKYQ